MLLHARLHTPYIYAGRLSWAVSLYTGFCFGRIDFENNLKHSPKSEPALAPKLSPFTQLLLIKQRKPFNPSPSACAFFFPLFPRLFFFTMGPLSHFQQRTILKVYQQLLVNPFLLLCALFSLYSSFRTTLQMYTLTETHTRTHNLIKSFSDIRKYLSLQNTPLRKCVCASTFVSRFVCFCV